MKPNTVKQALREGRMQLGCGFQQLRSQDVVRILAKAGFDWAFLDAEHGGFDQETLQDLCRIARYVGLSPVVRVADLQYDLIARALDCGGEGIIFPRVEDPELLARAVSMTKFPPLGERGCGITPLHLDFEAASPRQFMDHFNEHTLVVMQIETQRALDAREELLSVPHIDAVMVGPLDLSINLGVPGEFLHPKMIDAVEKIIASCQAHGVAPGTQTRFIQQAQFWKERGCTFLGCGSETGFMFEKAKEVAAVLKG
jgi:2-dehydro-3-deoxyglucarate aldolase/4-hydroxy-2-oxoheptanedioate aldolase